MEQPYKNFAEDRDYLFSKFRTPVYPADCGTDNETLRNGIVAFAETLGNLPVIIVKAKCYEHICQEIQVDVNPHDMFPAFGCYDRNRRPLTPLVQKNMAAVNAKYHQKSQPEVDKRNAAGIHRMWKDFDHSVPDWDAILTLGFPGLRDRARQYRARQEQAGTLTEDAKNYFDALEISINATIECIKRIISYAEDHSKNNPRITNEINCLRQLTIGAPRNTYEVLQIVYLHFIFCEHIDHMQVRSLGNFDQMLFPYYSRDLESGTFTEEQIREMLACFLMQWGSIDNYWGQPVYLGGSKKDGSTEINKFSWLFLDVNSKLEITTPKIQIKVAKNTPKDFILYALNIIRSGHSSIVFVCEESIRDTMMGIGYTEEQARTCDIKGCYEFCPRGEANGTCSAHINMLKPFELIFNDGTDAGTGFHVSLKNTQKLEDLKDFNDFYAAYLAYLNEATDAILELATDQEKYLQFINPGNMFSITIKNSLETATDAFSHGSKYNTSGILLVGTGTAVDALMAIKKYVYTDKTLTLSQFRDILKNNWQGQEKLRLQILHAKEKFGNGLPNVDFYAKNIVHFLANKVNLHPNGRNGFFELSGHTAKQYFDLGRCTGATPDGRLAGQEMSKNLSPTMGADTNGLTALVRSITTIASSDLPGDFPLDVMVHPATVAGDDGLEAMYAVIRTYMDRGGIAIHFNVFDASVLRDAQQHPENYENLQVRVCGWNVRFNDMAKVEQDAYIQRADNIAE